MLRNRLGLRDQTDLDAFEADATAQRFAEPLPQGRFSVSHYSAVHRHLFGDVYPWAGRFRRVRISKGGSTFCYPEHIAREMARIFAELKALNHLQGQPRDAVIPGLAHFLAELNAIHPFRDGNGRTQLAFVAQLAFTAGYQFDYASLEPAGFLAAMISSFQGDERPLSQVLNRLLSQIEPIK